MTREEAIKILKMNPQEIWRAGITMEEEKEAFNMAIEALKEERPHGEWVKRGDGSYKCAICCYSDRSTSNYCPNCGARMKEGDEK